MEFRKKLAELRETRGELCDRATAIVAVAESEKRAPSADEQTQIDTILASAESAAKEIERFEKLISFQDSLSASRVDSAATEAGGQVAATSRKPVIVPVAAQFRHGSLRAYRTREDQSDAFLVGQFVLATIGKNETASRWCRDHGVDTRFYGALTGETNTLGGFAIPVEMERRLIDLREERGVFRREARVAPMGSDTLTIPRRTGGVTAYFVGQNAEITASDPTLGNVELTARKLGAFVKYSSEVSEDAVISLADWITSEIAYSFADKEDECGFNGDGTSTYGGITGLKSAILAGSTYTAITGNTGFSTLDLEDFEAMVGKLPMYALQNAKWFISRAGWASSMLRLAEAAGGNTTANIEGGVRPFFLGFPVVFSQVMNSTLTAQVSTNGLAYFGDLAQAATLGTRRGVSLMSSTERYFELDQLAIKGTERFDIVVHERGTASAAGSIIMLATPAS